MKLRQITLLHNIELKEDFDVSDNIKIRKITKEDWLLFGVRVTSMDGTSMHFNKDKYGASFDNVTNSRVCMDLTIEGENSNDCYCKLDNEKDKILYTFWVACELNNIYDSWSYNKVINGSLEEWEFKEWISNDNKRRFFASKLLLKNEDIIRLQEYYQAISERILSDARLNFVFIQLELSKRKLATKLQIFKIINLVTILESLFLPGTKSELGFKLKTRVAKMLGKNKKEKQDICDNVHYGYDIRSQIVHGDFVLNGDINNLQNKKIDTTYIELMKKIDGYVYKSMSLFIKYPNKFTKENFKNLDLCC